MSLKTALFSYLSGKAAIAAIVDDRVYPMSAPASAELPYITYQQISQAPVHHFLAASTLTRVRMEIDSWSTMPLGADELGEAVRNALDGFRGAMGTEALAIRSCMLEDAQDDYEQPRDAGAVALHRVRQDFFIWHVVTVPTL